MNFVTTQFFELSQIEFCNLLSFWVVSIWVFWVLSKFDFEFFSSHFEFFSFVTIWLYEFYLYLKVFSFVTIWVFELSQFESFFKTSSDLEFLSFVVFWVFRLCQILSFVTFWVLPLFWVFWFCHILCFWVLSHNKFLSFVTF